MGPSYDIQHELRLALFKRELFTFVDALSDPVVTRAYQTHLENTQEYDTSLEMFEEGATETKPEKVDILKEFGVDTDSEKA